MYQIKFDPDFPIIKAEQGFEHPILWRGFWAAGLSFPMFVPSTTLLTLNFNPDFPIFKAEQRFEHPICGVAFGLRVPMLCTPCCV